MNLVAVERLSKSCTEWLLFDDTTFSISEGEEVGPVGINGTGKSTPLGIMTGLEEPGEETVAKGRNLYMYHLPQIPESTEDDVIMESILRDNVGESHYGPREEMQATVESMLNELRIQNHDAKAETLPGGRRKCVTPAGMLMSRAELLILDEPTNHLDSTMADQLEEYLKSFRGALLMITHDRCFLDSVVNRTVEPDKGKLCSYQGGYEPFLGLRADRLETAKATERKRQTTLHKEIAWIQRGARVWSTKQKVHIQCYEDLRDKKGPEHDRNVELESIASRLGRTTVEVRNLSKAYGDKVLMKDFTYVFLKSDRVGIVEPNGSGKSTLVKTIAGWVKPDSGMMGTGQAAKMGYFPQGNEAVDKSPKVIDYIKDVAEYIKTEDDSISASRMLERFLFPLSIWYTTISRLSGGERCHPYLLRILMEAPNAILLDEPTSNLDIQILTILENYLDTFVGTVITVSHDRYFLDRVVSRIFALEGQGIVTQHEGGFTGYQRTSLQRGADARDAGDGNVTEQDREDAEASQAVNRSNWKDSQSAPKKLKMFPKEQRDWETIEEEIAGPGVGLEELEKEILGVANNCTRLNELIAGKVSTGAQLEEKMDKWIYFNELIEKAEMQKRESPGIPDAKIGAGEFESMQ